MMARISSSRGGGRSCRRPSTLVSRLSALSALLLLLSAGARALSPVSGNCSADPIGSSSSGSSSSDGVRQRCADTGTLLVDDDELLNLDAARIRSTLASGRVYHHRNFLSEPQVQALLSEIDHLRSSGQFAPSGLSNTQKGKKQDFGEADRTVCAVPWWADSVAGRHTAFDEEDGERSGKDGQDGSGSSGSTDQQQQRQLRELVSQKLQSLRLYLSRTLNRPSMSDPALAHECYYSRSTPGARLNRHMDERHEETKGARGWLLESRRSVSWLVYLSTPADWTLDQHGGALRSFPQRKVRVKAGNVEAGCHGGNLQVGWLLPGAGSDLSGSSSGSEERRPSIPVYLDSWYRAADPRSGEVEPHCILYTVSIPEDGKKGNRKGEVTYITRPWLNDAIQGATAADFIREAAKIDSAGSNEANGPPSSAHPSSSLFVSREYARTFRLLEDRQLWEAGGIPDGSEVVDIPPERGSLVMFDSVSVPHEVRLVKDGTRAALAGWFHEKTQPFPDNFYDI